LLDLVSDLEDFVFFFFFGSFFELNDRDRFFTFWDSSSPETETTIFTFLTGLLVMVVIVLVVVVVCGFFRCKQAKCCIDVAGFEKKS